MCAFPEDVDEVRYFGDDACVQPWGEWWCPVCDKALEYVSMGGGQRWCRAADRTPEQHVRHLLQRALAQSA